MALPFLNDFWCHNLCLILNIDANIGQLCSDYDDKKGEKMNYDQPATLCEYRVL